MTDATPLSFDLPARAGIEAGEAFAAKPLSRIAFRLVIATFRRAGTQSYFPAFMVRAGGR